MIPHIMTGTVYTLDILLECSKNSKVELHDLSTFDSFKDSFEWIGAKGFDYSMIPKERKGNHVTLKVYIHLEEGRSIGDDLRIIRDELTHEISVRARGSKISRFGKPHLFLRLDSIEGRIADEEEIRTERIFSEITDS